MSFSNDDMFRLKNGESQTLSLSTSVYNSNEVQEVLVQKMKSLTGVANKLLHLLLVMRNKPYSLDRKLYSQAEVDKQLKDLCRSLPVKTNLEKFKIQCSDFYSTLVFKKDKNGKFKETTNSNARAYVGTVFSQKDIKLDTLTKSAKFLRDCKLFPLLDMDLGPNDETSYRFIVMQNVLESLASLEAKQINYDSEKENWSEKITSAKAKLSHIEGYGNLLEQIRGLKDYEGFGLGNYKRLLNSWRGRPNSTNEIRKNGMRNYFLQCPSDKVFVEQDKYLFGYEAHFMSLIFENHKSLWFQEDVIGDQKYIDVIFGAYHWRKECVNIVTFGNNGKLNRITLGHDFLPYELVHENNNFILRFGHPTDEGKKAKMNLILSRCPHFDEHTKITLVAEKGENGKRGNNGYKIEYTRDVGRKTHYQGMIKQPMIRWHALSERLFVDIPVSQHQVVGSTLDPRVVSGQNYFKASALGNSKGSKEKTSLDFDSFRVMGVDIGVTNAYAHSICDVKNDRGALSITKEVCSGTNRKSPSLDAKKSDIQEVLNMIDSLSSLISSTKSYIYGDDKITGLYNSRKRSINWAKNLGIDIKQYEEFLAPYKIMEDKKMALSQLKYPSSNWIVHSLHKELDRKVNVFRGEWRHAEDKAYHNREENMADYFVFAKKKVVKNLISLKRSISTLGTSSKETMRMRTNFCSNLQKWHKGLSRKCNDIAAEIINIARANKVQFLAIEDLDCTTHYDDSNDENSLKSLMCFGEFKAMLGNQSKKHHIGVVMVDPDFTSQMDSLTGEIGYRVSRTLFVKRHGKIYRVDCDINAARNIIRRMISRHADLPAFKVEKIGDNQYRTIEMGKRRSGALLAKIGTTNCIFEELPSGELKVAKTNLSKEDLSISVMANSKNTYAIYNGGKWFTKAALEKEVAQYAK